MYGCWEKNFVPITFYFEKEIPDIEKILFDYSIKLFDNKKSKLRMKVLPDATFSYDNRDTNELVFIFLNKLNEINDQIVEKKSIDSGLPAIICYTNDTVSFCANHLFMDGISMYNLMLGIFDHEYKVNISNFKYIPIFSELFLAPKLKHIRKFNRVLDYYPSWKEENSKTKMIDYQFKIEDIKNLKKKVSILTGSKIAYASCTTALIINSTFKTKQNISRLTIGVLVAFDSKKRFNNYGAIVFTISKNEYKSLEALIYLINEKMTKLKETAVLNFIARNVYNLNIDFGSIDILMSGFPMSIDKPISLNGILLKKTRQFLKYHSTPIYCMYLSCTRFTNMTICIRSRDINKDTFKDKLINQI